VSTAATAALLVAIGLLVLAAAACAVQMTPVRDARLRRLARLYLDPLSTWCLAAVVVHALTTVAAGDVVALELVLPIGIGIAAFLLRWADEPADAPAPSAPVPGRTTTSPSPAPTARTVEHSPAPARTGWRRAARPDDPTPPAPSPAAPVRPATGSLWSRGT
jgi:hypothetical protein